MATIEWRPRKLNELGFVGRGKSRHRPRNAKFLYGGPYPFFQTGDIKAANFHLTDYTQTYSEAGLAQSKLWKPGTLCITIAANIAESAILGIEGCFPDSVVGFIADPDKADVSFIKYYMDTLKVQMQNMSRGTTQDNLRLDKLLMFDFLIPPLHIQQRIAGILSAYDNLIENNQRRIQILEDIARSLYREWFVKFSFPGHEKVRMVPSELGKIPEGWGITSLDKIADIFRGRSYRSENLSKNIGLPFLNLKCIDRDGGFRRSGIKRYVGEFKDEQIVRKGDILIAITDMTQERRLVAHAALVPSLSDDFGVFSMDLIRIAAKSRIPPVFLYCLLRFSAFSEEVKQYANGANVLHLSPTKIADYMFTLPAQDLIINFASVCDSIFKNIDLLELKSENLRRTRDLLLPRLMSGQIDLNVAEI